MSNINVSAYVVSANGSVDVEASVGKFRGALATFLAERETEQSVIAEAVSAVFDKNPGVIAMPALAGLALQELNAAPETFAKLHERVLGYVRESAKGTGAIFKIQKGKGGGVSRIVNAPATV
jgi:hypothetical protein